MPKRSPESFERKDLTFELENEGKKDALAQQVDRN
jgi:hypothetical protein